MIVANDEEIKDKPQMRDILENKWYFSKYQHHERQSWAVPDGKRLESLNRLTPFVDLEGILDKNFVKILYKGKIGQLKKKTSTATE